MLTQMVLGHYCFVYTTLYNLTQTTYEIPLMLAGAPNILCDTNHTHHLSFDAESKC